MSTEPTRSGEGLHLDPSRLSFWADVDVDDRNDVEDFLAAVEADREASPSFSADLPSSTVLGAEYGHLRSCLACASRLGEVASAFAFAVQRTDHLGPQDASRSSEGDSRRRDAVAAALVVFDEGHARANAPLDRQAKVSWWRRRSAAGSGVRGVGAGGARGSLTFTPAQVLAGAAALCLVTGVVLFQQRESDSTANAPITDAAPSTEVDAASGGNGSPLESRSGESDAVANSAESVVAPNQAAATEAAATGSLKAPSAGVQGESSVPVFSGDDRAALDMVMPAEAPSAVPTDSPTTPRPPSTQAAVPTIPSTRRSATTVPTPEAAATTPAAGGRVGAEPVSAEPVSAEPVFDALASTVTTRGGRAPAKKAPKKATPTSKASATTTAATPQAAAASSAPALPAADLGDLGSFADLAAGSDALRQLAVQRGVTASPSPVVEAPRAPAPATTAAPASVRAPPAASSTTSATVFPSVSPAAGSVEAAPAVPLCQVPGAYAVARLSVAGRPLLGFVTGPPQTPVVVFLDPQACTIVG